MAPSTASRRVPAGSAAIARPKAVPTVSGRWVARATETARSFAIVRLANRSHEASEDHFSFLSNAPFSEIARLVIASLNEWALDR